MKSISTNVEYKEAALDGVQENVQKQLTSRVLGTKKAADYLNYAPQTLANWRVAGVGPPWIQRGPKGKVLYQIDELDRWLATHLRKSTSDLGGGNVR
jgi:hypothetical protein